MLPCFRLQKLIFHAIFYLSVLFTQRAASQIIISENSYVITINDIQCYSNQNIFTYLNEILFQAIGLVKFHCTTLRANDFPNLQESQAEFDVLHRISFPQLVYIAIRYCHAPQ